jgi:3-oxoacyl-[acyl-carrier protein] reductase
VTAETVLVTGASRGLGRAIAAAFAARGAKVYAGYLTNEREAMEAAAAANSAIAGGAAGGATAGGATAGGATGAIVPLRFDMRDAAAGGATAGAIVPLRFDVRDAAACAAAIDRAVAETGRLDVVVHAAGVARDAFFALSGPDDWDDPIAVNLGGALRVARAAVRPMLAAKRGAIVLVGSIAGLRASPGQAGYAASKGGIVALTQTLGAELAPRGIRVNAVVPGLIQAGMVARLDQRVVGKQVARIPAGRLGTADEVAQCALFLASDAAAYVYGQSLVVDGGLSL